jgi:hypothetical protein
MVELPIKLYEREPAPGYECVRWRVWLGENVSLIVEMSDVQVMVTDLSDDELDERLPAALQFYAGERLSEAKPVVAQALAWAPPIVLQSKHFYRRRHAPGTVNHDGR